MYIYTCKHYFFDPDWSFRRGPTFPFDGECTEKMPTNFCTNHEKRRVWFWVKFWKKNCCLNVWGFKNSKTLFYAWKSIKWKWEIFFFTKCKNTQILNHILEDIVISQRIALKNDSEPERRDPPRPRRDPLTISEIRRDQKRLDPPRLF